MAGATVEVIQTHPRAKIELVPKYQLVPTWDLGTPAIAVGIHGKFPSWLHRTLPWPVLLRSLAFRSVDEKVPCSFSDLTGAA